MSTTCISEAHLKRPFQQPAFHKFTGKVGLTIISTTYISEIRSKQITTLEMGR